MTCCFSKTFFCTLPNISWNHFAQIRSQNVFLPPKARDFHGLHGLFRFTRLAVQQLLGILFAPRQRGGTTFPWSQREKREKFEASKQKKGEHMKNTPPKLKEGCFGGFLGLVVFFCGGFGNVKIGYGGVEEKTTWYIYNDLPWKIHPDLSDATGKTKMLGKWWSHRIPIRKKKSPSQKQTQIQVENTQINSLMKTPNFSIKKIHPFLLGEKFPTPSPRTSRHPVSVSAPGGTFGHLSTSQTLHGTIRARGATCRSRQPAGWDEMMKGQYDGILRGTRF